MSVLRGVVLPERYEPIRRVASGGMAWVWCARDRTLDRHVAIKLLAEPFAHDEVAARRFKREARVAARLSGHSNVVTIYDVGQSEPSEESPAGRPFIVMEYLAGGTVADARRVGSVDQGTAVRWLQQAAAALDYAHARDVIHRDVKLSNFLLDRDQVLHVADFGIAQLGTEDTLTVAGEVLGTAGYLAPERALGHPATAASDRYALAVAAFELLVGERPFGAENFTAQARQHVEDPPPHASRRNPALPPALDPVLTRGMAKDPQQRFASAGELVAAIEQALRNEGPTRALALAPAGLAHGLSRAGRGGRRRIAAVAALGAAALAVGIAAAENGGSSPSLHAAARTHTLTHAQAPKAAKAPPVATTPAAVTPTHTTTHAAPKPPKPAPTPPQPTGADALQAQGHQLMLGGDYSAAIPLLRQAVATAAQNSLIYAYALYDLGRSLRLAGDPRAAVTVLYQRLQIPNQTDVVRSELALALRALGQQTGGAAPAPHRAHGARVGGPPPPGGQGD
ncbi:MAG TPA: serine/threonine-protein kinase [Solirubrobacteraceae bacterium]|nr:serine/threonine-protein kinase [Solirubrobacteraceae bacterium]